VRGLYFLNFPGEGDEGQPLLPPPLSKLPSHPLILLTSYTPLTDAKII